MSPKLIAAALKEAFFEGYSSYATPCIAHNSVEEAWENSYAKDNYDRILNKVAPLLQNRG